MIEDAERILCLEAYFGFDRLGDIVPCTDMTLHCCLPIDDIQGSLRFAFCSSSVVVNWLIMVVKRDCWLNSEE